MKNYLKQNRGFTLVQLIVVVSIITVLATAAVLGEDVINRIGKAKDVQRWEDLTAIAKAVELYQLDNDALPASLATANIWPDSKVVLCSSAAELTCDGQSRPCLVVNDSDFLAPYLGGNLPVDPEKSVVTDTGYYIGRSGDRMVLGACDSYEATPIEYVVKASLGEYSATCGNGIKEGDEACDDGNIIKEGCGNGILEVGTYCYSDCSIIMNLHEVCDYNTWSQNCDENGIWYTITDVGSGEVCAQDCQSYSNTCMGVPQMMQ